MILAIVNRSFKLRFQHLFLTSFISFLNISQKPSQLTVYLDIILFWKVIIFYGNDASTATVSLSDIITLDLVEDRELRCL